MRVVLDTNIIVSALISPHGHQSLVLTLGLQRFFDICVSAPVLAEYQEVLGRPRFNRLDRHSIKSALEAIRTVGCMVYPTRVLRLSPHDSDNRFYECADAGRAQYLVTANTRHFPVDHGHSKIITAKRLLELLS